MSGPSSRPGGGPSPVAIWLGMLVFGVLDAPLLLGIADVTRGWSILGQGALFAAGVAALALAGLALRRRGFATGLLAGYALMGLASGGACTLFAPAPTAAPVGALLYVVALALFGAGLLIRRRRQRESETWHATSSSPEEADTSGGS